MSASSSTSSVDKLPPEEYKIAIIGDSGAGKSSLAIRLYYDFFGEDEQHNSRNSEIYRKKIYLDGKACILGLVDTPSPEEGSSSNSLAERAIQGTDAVIIVYNISKLPWRSTPLTVIRKYYDLVKVVKGRQNKPLEEFPVLIMGAQNDRVEERVVEAVDAENLASELGCWFAEGSAKDGDVERPVFDLVRKVRDQRSKQEKARELERKDGERKRDRLKGVLDQLEDISHKAWVFG